MKLKIIYGKAGSGKSTYLFDYVKDIISNPQKIYIITPEQFSFTAEKKLLENTGGAAINAEVLTFSRMAYRVIKEVGNNLKNIEAFGRTMLLYDILDTKKKNLQFLGKNMQNVEVLEKTLSELKKHNITQEKLEDVIEKTEDEYLKIKLKDIQKIYDSYEEKIKEKFLDENDILNVLSENIKNTNMFDNSVILIDEFAGFTPQEYKIIEELMKIAKEISVTMTLDKIDEVREKTDIFYYNKLAVEKLINIAKMNNVEIEEPVFLHENFRFKNEELIHLEKNIYSNIYKRYEKSNENIKLFLEANPYSEIEYVASQIIKEVRENEYRYKEIGIITKNIDTYSALIKAIFEKYDIPVYIDEKKDLSQNILIKYIVSVLDVFIKNWSYDSVIAYAKTMFCDIEENEIYALENYCKRWGIKYSKWYKEDWDFGEENKETLKKLNETRKKIVMPLLKFKEKCVKEQSAKIITKAIYEFLIENEIDKKLKNKAEKLEKINADIASEYEASFNIVMKILDEIVKIFGDEKVSFEKYNYFLKISFAGNGLGKIPVGMDQVTVGDVDRSRSHKVRIMFIIRSK